MTVLLYVLAAYVAVCWLWGMYLAIRLYSGRRISRLVRGRGIRPRLTRTTHQDTSNSTRPKGTPQIASATLAKAEAAAAKSRAA